MAQADRTLAAGTASWGRRWVSTWSPVARSEAASRLDRRAGRLGGGRTASAGCSSASSWGSSSGNQRLGEAIGQRRLAAVAAVQTRPAALTPPPAAAPAGELSRDRRRPCEPALRLASEQIQWS